MVRMSTAEALEVFQSTSSVWRTTVIYNRAQTETGRFQSTSSVWRTTPFSACMRGIWYISIHVLRVEDDRRLECSGLHCFYFNPRPPCGGRPFWDVSRPKPAHFNPRPPCGGRRGRTAQHGVKCDISIHVLRVEDDYSAPMYSSELFGFQSTSSVWRTTRYCKHPSAAQWYFNPRPPCGGRPDHEVSRDRLVHFNPRPPCGGRQQKQRKISICTHIIQQFA